MNLEAMDSHAWPCVPQRGQLGFRVTDTKSKGIKTVCESQGHLISMESSLTSLLNSLVHFSSFRWVSVICDQKNHKQESHRQVSGEALL